MLVAQACSWGRNPKGVTNTNQQGSDLWDDQGRAAGRLGIEMLGQRKKICWTTASLNACKDRLANVSILKRGVFECQQDFLVFHPPITCTSPQQPKSRKRTCVFVANSSQRKHSSVRMILCDLAISAPLIESFTNGWKPYFHHISRGTMKHCWRVTFQYITPQPMLSKFTFMAPNSWLLPKRRVCFGHNVQHS